MKGLRSLPGARSTLPAHIVSHRRFSSRYAPQAALASTAEKQQAETPVSQQPFRFGSRAEQGLREGMEDEEQPGGLSESNQQIPEALKTAFQSADDVLLGHLEALGGVEQEQAGSTATVMMLWPNRVVVANVGDSQAFLWRKGQAFPLTTPHRVYGPGPEVTSEVDRVKSTGGWVYDGRVCNILAVSRAFGDWEFKGKGLPQLLTGGVKREYWPEHFISTVNFTSDPVIVTPDASDNEITQADEFLVVSTDGLWDVMEPREVMLWARKELQKGKGPEEVAESLVQLALKRHTTDNTSVLVVDLKGPEFWAKQGPAAKQGGLFGWFGK